MVALAFNQNYARVLASELLRATVLLLAAPLAFYLITVKPVMDAYDVNARTLQTEMILSGLNMPVQAFLFMNDRLPGPGELDLGEIRDAWDNDFVHRISENRNGPFILLISSGPDETLDTVDDIILIFYADGSREKIGGLLP